MAKNINAHRNRRNNTLAARPADYAVCNSIQEVLDLGAARIPAYLWAEKCLSLPLTAKEAEDTFASVIQPFSVKDVDDFSLSPNLGTGATVNTTTLVVGIGIIGVGESKSMTLQGAAVTRPEGTDNDVPCFDGCISEILENDPGARNAVFQWGGPTWEALTNFFQAYILEMVLCNRYLIVQELLSEIGMVAEAGEMIGFGDGNFSAMPLIRNTNDVMKEKGFPCAFIPQNDAGSTCVPAPVGPIQWGHPRIKGISNRIFCLPRPIMLVPGMSINIDMVAKDAPNCFRPKLLEDVTGTGCVGQSPDAAFGEDNTCGNKVSAITIPGGNLTFGVVLKCVELTPQAVLDYFATCCTPNMAAMYIGNPTVSTMVKDYLAAGGKGRTSFNTAILQGLADASGQTLRNIQQQQQIAVTK